LGAIAQHKTTKKADNAFQNGYWNAAIENYKLALKKEKDNEIKLQIMYNMAQSYAGAKEYKNAVTWFKKVERKGKVFISAHPEALLKMATAYKSLDQYEDAMNAYKAYSDLKPDDELILWDPITTEGEYLLAFTVARTPGYGKIKFELNGEVLKLNGAEEHDLSTSYQAIAHNLKSGNVKLKPGMQVITIKPADDKLKPLGLDFIWVKKQ
jgi:tetratricopeptide (TPR) repeat protein